jgi:molybdopterin molybdotransferase
VISVDAARAQLIAAFGTLGVEDVQIAEALGRTLAAPLRASRDQPPFAASAMDGYALQAGATPQNYAIVGEAAAGHAFTRALNPGEAVRISTGAPIPAGADSVLIQEEAKREGDTLVGAHVRAGKNVRPRAGDFAAGDLLLEQGRKLDPVALALAAGGGFSSLQVTRRPRITVFAGGDEVVPPGGAVRDDQVFESGSFAVCGFIEKWGGAATRGAVLPDEPAAIERAAAAALEQSDLIVLIGGASVGPHDHARPALARLGLQTYFDKIAVRPGKPTWFASSPRGKALGLPGNPASAIACAVLFLKPVVEAMLGGAPEATLRFRRAPLAQALGANGDREHYLRAMVGEDGRILAFSDQDSSLLTIFSRANALLRRLPNAPAAQADETVEYLAYDG